MSSSRSSRSASASASRSSRSAEPSGLGGSSSRGTSDRREAEAFPSNVAIVGSETAFGTYQTETTWPEPEFGDRTDIKNVNGKTCKGTILAAGTMFPLGMAIPSDTVLPYGMYLPPGTMLPDGAIVPIHTRMVSVVPLPTKRKETSAPEETWCCIM
ncbi:hypothetical protein QFC20_003883 [Naganishia adeliensis]|uniref:Uncharacterized protein n=1 Tax=Naganishia adeliensis TaxID=92952 RepID=A0ACC2W6D7_9TREE|nr:hypothetical protein QFC20_003883 [Naganishia adeliensis]